MKNYDALTAIGGQSAPPSLKHERDRINPVQPSPYRGAVRPPFIEAPAQVRTRNKTRSIGGQSAPPSLKLNFREQGERNAVPIGGQSAPPSLKLTQTQTTKMP